MTNIKFTATKTLLSYDLYNNDISASEILVDGITHPLPSTLLVSSYEGDIALIKFAEALQAAKALKPSAKAKLKNLFVAEIFSKSGCIQHFDEPVLEAVFGIYM